MTEPETVDSELVMKRLFPDFADSVIEKFLSYFSQKPFQAGQVLIQQGETDQNLFIVLSGEFAVFKKIRLNCGDLVFRTAHFPAPSMIGEINMLVSQERTATVLATESGMALLMDEEAISRLEKNDPELAILVMKEAARRMHGIAESFRKNMYKSVLGAADNHQQALLQAQRWFGAWTDCPREIALKLFPRYDGENYSSI
jgi:CRP-like cAMP-binding protein